LDADDGGRLGRVPPQNRAGARDDHPGQALAYYASRGETPLLWGGRGAEALGLEGAVTDELYQAVFGPGGACDPTTGERLVHTKRPGLELVISAHKPVAELGVIGRAEDMHSIMDAERDATLGFTRIVACLRDGVPYQLRDVDGRPITPAEGRVIVAAHYQIPAAIRAERRVLSKARNAPRRDERTRKGVARRSTVTPVPQPA
jgi:hypothetical protein